MSGGPRSPALAAYQALATVAGPAVGVWLRRRADRGKEDPARLGERSGHASRPRPPGPLLWLHAASVGEALSALPLIEALRTERPDVAPLLTTGTVTSAALMAERLPEGAVHQFLPVDAGRAPARFLDHWRPDAAVWIESELWPALIEAAAAQGVPLLLLNARISARSARGWAWAPGMIRRLLGRFDAILAQDAEGAARFVALGADPARVSVAGSLKAGAAPPDRPEARFALAGAAAGRPLWLAASTHAGEEAAVAEAHRRVATGRPDLLTLIAPRHPERGAEIAASLCAAGLSATRRGAGEAPGPGTALHVLDTLGEMGAWLRLAPVCFLGGSLADRGGHNPHEPVALGSALIAGPHVGNFAEDYAALGPACRRVADAAGLAEAVTALLCDPAARMAQAAAARAALPDGGGARAAALAAVLARLPAADG